MLLYSNTSKTNLWFLNTFLWNRHIFVFTSILKAFYILTLWRLLLTISVKFKFIIFFDTFLLIYLYLIHYCILQNFWFSYTTKLFFRSPAIISKLILWKNVQTIWLRNESWKKIDPNCFSILRIIEKSTCVVQTIQRYEN